MTLLRRHEIRVESFDSPAGWVEPKELCSFLEEPGFERPWVMIRSARRPGSMPEDVAHSLRRAEASGLLRIQRGEVRRVTFRPTPASGSTCLDLRCAPTRYC